MLENFSIIFSMCQYVERERNNRYIVNWNRKSRDHSKALEEYKAIQKLLEKQREMIDRKTRPRACCKYIPAIYETWKNVMNR
jgi:hypothetical protein